MAADIEQLYRSVETSDGFDRLLPLESILETAEAKGGLKQIPQSEKAFDANADIIIRLKNRLYHLGYLSKLRESSDMNERERKALKQYQTDAGVTVDGWVGQESWQVLEDLFSFEADSHIEHWTSDDKFLPLLKRAVQLRLFALGLLKDPPSERRVDTFPGLKAFVDLAHLFGLSSEELQPGFSAETLGLLFDQDRISRGIARMAGQTDLTRNAKVKSFVVCNAKIELWLLGYPIFPDGKGVYKKPPVRQRRIKGRPRPRSPRAYTTFYKALEMFSSDVNPARSKPLSPKLFEKQFAEFFEEFAEVQSGQPDATNEPDSAMLVEVIRSKPEIAQEEWANQQSFAGRLWDGIKRAWGWIKRLFRKAVDAAVSLVRNAVRVVWNLAIHSAGIVRAAITTFPAAVHYFLKPEVDGADKAALVFCHDKDFDWRIYVAPNPSRSAVANTIRCLHNQVVRFTFSVRLVGFLIHALFQSVRFLPTGYFAVFLAISRIQPILEPFIEYYKANQSELTA
jgi:hypothetical protein